MSTKNLEKTRKNKEKKGNMDELAKLLGSQIGIEIDDPQTKTKTSFYITRLTQILLKKLSETYKISQGDIINQTPFLFANIMQRSLERRKRNIATLITLEQEIISSIDKMISIAPHLSLLLNYATIMISQVVDAEKQAVEKKVISGLGIEKFDEGLLMALPPPFESEPAYQKDLDDLMEDTDWGELWHHVFESLTKEGAPNEG